VQHDRELFPRDIPVRVEQTAAYAGDNAVFGGPQYAVRVSLRGRRCYEPTAQGSEARIKERLAQIEEWKAKNRGK
jgi:hypothetical protein